uniref:Uncharacterized protein n=1 Tax=Knipowitschia caucasica TaxID=637954 RepID=A0AAV2LMH8_KNICA
MSSLCLLPTNNRLCSQEKRSQNLYQGRGEPADCRREGGKGKNTGESTGVPHHQRGRGKTRRANCPAAEWPAEELGTAFGEGYAW